MPKITIKQGDISEEQADALVNAANNQLWMGSGVAGALKRRGGRQIEEEAMLKGPIGVGEAVATSAGNLKARYVIHAAVMGQDLTTDAGKIRSATRNTLTLANSLKLRSIAFPALGTGVGAFPPAECAKIMLGEVRAHFNEPTTLEEVIFVLHGQDAFLAFQQSADPAS